MSINILYNDVIPAIIDKMDSCSDVIRFSQTSVRFKIIVEQMIVDQLAALQSTPQPCSLLQGKIEALHHQPLSLQFKKLYQEAYGTDLNKGFGLFNTAEIQEIFQEKQKEEDKALLAIYPEIIRKIPYSPKQPRTFEDANKCRAYLQEQASNLQLVDCLTLKPFGFGKPLPHFELLEQITVIPAEIGSLLGRIVELDIRRIKNLKIIPPGIFTLKLKSLRIISAQLTVIPAEIERLKDVQILSFMDNQIENIPIELSRLLNLKTLLLTKNNIQKIPPEINGFLQNLENFKVDENPPLSNQ